MRLDILRLISRIDDVALAPKSWTKHSECLPDSVLRRSEWYNDFVLRGGVRDIVGIKLVRSASHSVIFGLHQRIGWPFAEETAWIMKCLSAPLRRAARRHLQSLPSPDSPTHDRHKAEGSVGGTTYYYHVCNGRRYPDATGSVFPSAAEAISHAYVLAAELLRDAGWDEFSIQVTNEQGDEIAKVPMRLCASERLPHTEG